MCVRPSVGRILAGVLVTLTIAAPPANAARFEASDVRQPVYSAAANAVLFPVTVSTGQAGIIALDLTTWTLSVKPAPCGLDFQKLVLLQDGRILAAWGYQIVKTRVPIPGRLFPKRIYENANDLVFFDLPSFAVTKSRAAHPNEYIEDIGPSDDEYELISSVRVSSIHPSGPISILRAIDTRDWGDRIIWPNINTWARNRDKQFTSLTAPKFMDGDYMIVRATLLRNNREFASQMMNIPSNQYWKIKRYDNSIINAQNEFLSVGWSFQLLGDSLYFDVAAATGKHTPLIYSLRERVDDQSRDVLKIGPRFNWFYVFDYRNERVVMISYDDGWVRLLKIQDGAVIGQIEVARILEVTPRSTCGPASAVD